MISRIIAACVLVLGLLTFATSAQAAEPEFTWSSSVSTTQAGGHPSVTLNFASSSTQSLTRLDVDLPQGLMHRNNMTGACSNPLYAADSCPASSVIGSVTTQLVVARVPISVPGTIYQLSAPTGDAAASFGIVLRPPLSSLGLTGKIFLRNQVSFTNGGGLRSSLVGPMSSVSVLGATLPARIAQLRLQYSSQAPSGGTALISNPTSCKPQAFTAVGTFSSGTTRPRTSSFTTTGCPAVPFAPAADVKLTNYTAGEKSGVEVAIGNPAGGSVAALHPGHVTSFWNDWEDVLDYDLEAIENGPTCSDEQAAASACPAASQLGEISVDIEGFGPATGKFFATNSPGHKTVGEITLRGGATARFSGVIGGENKSTLSFTGLPQLPFTAIRVKTTTDSAWITNTCAIRTSRMSIESHSGARVDRSIQHGKPTCPPPAAPTITEGPERGITISTSHVEYRFTAPESDATFECKKDDAEYTACASPFVDDWQGEGVHIFSVRAVRDGVVGPATTATFTVDTMPPVVTFVGDEYNDADGDGVADRPFRTEDFSLEFDASDATSGIDDLRLACSFQSDSDPTAPSTRGVKQPRPHTQGHVQCGGPALAPSGPGTVSVMAYDFAGHVTVLKMGVIVDGSPPSIAIDEPGVQFSDGSSVEVAFTAEDDSLHHAQGELVYVCERKGWDGTVKGGSAKIITDRDTGRSKGFCTFADVPDGSYKVTVRGWDPVRKEAFAEGDLTVDRTAPVITLTNPEDADADGDGIADNRWRSSSIDVAAELTDLESGIDPASTSCSAAIRNKGVVKGNINVMSGNRIVCTVGGLPDEDVDVELRAHNYVGTVTIVKRGFTVDTTPPTVTFTDPYDFDADGDGFSDGRVRASRLGYEIRVDDARGIGVDPNSGACEAKNRNGGTVKGNVTISNGSLLRCLFEGLPSGDTDIEIRAADYRGHVTVLKAAVTIESPPPVDRVLTILTPTSGQSFPQGGTMVITHTMTGVGPFTYRCAIDNVVVLASCASGSSITLAGVSTGSHVLKVIAYDSAGSYEATRSFNIASDGPPVCAAIYPPPPGCPGYVPPGGVITLP